MGKRKEEALPPKSEGAVYAEVKLQRYTELRQNLNEFKGFKRTGLDNLIRVEEQNAFNKIEIMYEYEYIIKDSLLEYERSLEKEIAEIEEIFGTLIGENLSEVFYYDVSAYRMVVGVTHDDWGVDDFTKVEGFEGLMTGAGGVVKSTKKIKGLKELEENIDF